MEARQVASARGHRFSVDPLRHERGARVERHAHERPYLQLVVAGDYEEALWGETLHAASGRCVFKPAGMKHSYRFGTGSTALRIAWSDDLASFALHRGRGART